MEHCAPLWGEEAHEMGVWFLSEMEMECCAPVWGEEAHELGVWFLSEMEMECCVPLCGVRKPMSWVCRSL
jgi:hypothetical protein